MERATIPQPELNFAGMKLGKYEVLARLSAGGMSLIFLAFQRGLGDFRKLVVLKQILPDIQQDPDAVAMFLDEANISAAFSHPNVAQVFDLDVQDSALFLAMEFVNGASLLELIRQGSTGKSPPPLGLTLMVVRDVALALHYAHTFRDPTGRVRQVMHRDVAPKNVMVTFDGVTKLMDFGIAKAMGAMKRTRVGIVRGTWGYMAPEQIRGEELDPRCDLFSLGVVLHECFTRQRLFLGKTPEEGFDLTLKERPRPPSELNPELPPALDAVVLRALEKNRLERFQSGLEMARAIERAAGPLLWLPEQAGAFVQSIFGARRESAERLLAQASRDITGVFDISFYRALQQDDGPSREKPSTPLPRSKPRPSAPSARARPPESGPDRQAAPGKTPPQAVRTLNEDPTHPSLRPLPPTPAARGAVTVSARRPLWLPVMMGACTSFALMAGVYLGRTVLGPTAGSLAPAAASETRSAAAQLGATAASPSRPAPPATEELVGPPAPGPPGLAAAPPPSEAPGPAAAPTAEGGSPPAPADGRAAPEPARLSTRGISAEGVAVATRSGGRLRSRVRDGTGARTREARQPPPADARQSDDAPPPSTADEPPPSAAPSEPPGPEPAARPSAAARNSAEAPSTARTGTLSLVTEPPAEVWLNARSLGTTPLSRLPLSVGRHTVRLVGPDERTMLLRVDIRPDEETSLHLPLDGASAQ